MGFPFTEMYLPKHRYDKWQEFKQVIYDPHFAFQDDLEADDWLAELRMNEELQRGLIRNHQPNVITSRFFEMLGLRLRPKHNVILILVGAPGDGKTILAAMLTWEKKKIIPDMKIEVTTSYNQMIDSFVSSEHHKTTVFDENLKNTDVGSDVIRVHVDNFIKELREHEHNIIYEIKTYEPIPFATYYIICFGYNEETGETRALVRSKRGHYLGLIILKKEYDEAHFEPFAKAKHESFVKLQKSRGKVDAFDGLDKEAIAKAVIDTIQEHHLCATRNSEVVEIFDMHEFTEKHPEIMIPMREIKVEIARQVLIRLKGNKQLQEKESSAKSKLTAVVLSEQVLSDPDFLQRQLRLASSLIPEPYLTTFKLKAAHQSNLEISKMAHIATGSASNYLVEVQQNWLGDLGEMAQNEILTELGEYFTWEGRNSTKPDFTLFSDAVHSQVKEIRSLKNYVYFRRNKALTEIGKQEILLARKTGAPLFEYCYEINTESWHIFEVDPWATKIDDDDCVLADPAALPTESGLNTPSPPAAAPPPAASPLPTPPTEGGCSPVMMAQQKRKKRRRSRR